VVAAPAEPVVATPVAASVQRPLQRAVDPLERFPGFREEARTPIREEYREQFRKPVSPPAIVYQETTSEQAHAPVPAETVVPERHSTPGAYVPSVASEPRPELIPVPASVFDDDFFRKPNEELRASAPPQPAEPGHWPEAKVPTFGTIKELTSGITPVADDLDIPAFLRRNT
jgi:cell division protein FtsZ